MHGMHAYKPRPCKNHWEDSTTFLALQVNIIIIVIAKHELGLLTFIACKKYLQAKPSNLLIKVILENDVFLQKLNLCVCLCVFAIRILRDFPFFNDHEDRTCVWGIPKNVTSFGRVLRLPSLKVIVPIMGTNRTKSKCSSLRTTTTTATVNSDFCKTYSSIPCGWILNSEKLFVIFCLTVLAIPPVRLGKEHSHFTFCSSLKASLKQERMVYYMPHCRKTILGNCLCLLCQIFEVEKIWYIIEKICGIFPAHLNLFSANFTRKIESRKNIKFVYYSLSKSVWFEDYFIAFRLNYS